MANLGEFRYEFDARQEREARFHRHGSDGPFEQRPRRPYGGFESETVRRDSFDEILTGMGEEEGGAPAAPVNARILWPALGFPAVIAPKPHGSSDPLASDPANSLCVLIVSDHKYISKEDAARYLRIVPWPNRTRRQIPRGQPGSFNVNDLEVRNDDRGQKLVWPQNDEQGEGVVFGATRSLEPGTVEGDSPILGSLSRHVREFYRKCGLGNLHEIRVSEGATAKLPPGQYHLFWNDEAARSAAQPSAEMQLLLDRFARPRREGLGSKWTPLLPFLMQEYTYDFNALHPPYQQRDPQQRLTEVLHPVFVTTESRPVRFSHITDIHVNTRDDVYEANLRQQGRLAVSGYNNFNRSFEDIYRQAKQNSDAVLLTGDLIDYGRGHIGLALGGSYANTLGQDDAYHKDRNWFLLYYLLASGENYKVPIYTCLGNHDWRVNPYPPFAPGAPELGVLFDTQKPAAAHLDFEALLKTAHGPGHEKHFAYSLAAENAWQAFWGLLGKPATLGKVLLQQYNTEGSPLQTSIESVLWYLLLINPFLDYSIKLPGGQQVLMLDWGKDEEVVNTDEPRSWQGFGQRAAKSLTSLQKWHVDEFAGRPGHGKLIGMHAPPVGPFPEWSDSDLAKGVKVFRQGEDSRARWSDGTIKLLRPSHHLFAIRPKDAPINWVAAEYGSFIREREWFIRRVSDARAGIRIIVSGHNHRNGLFTAWTPRQDRSAMLLQNVTESEIRGAQFPVAGANRKANTTYLEPLYVNTTSGGPRGNRYENGHTNVLPGYAAVVLAGDGTIGGVWFLEATRAAAAGR